MGKRLSDERRADLFSDLASRLRAVAPLGRRAMPQDIVAASDALANLLGHDTGVDEKGPEGSALIAAVRALAKAQAEGSGADGLPSCSEATAKWIEKYINPGSPSALPGAERLWERGLNYQRDVVRRARLKGSIRPVSVKLSAPHRAMLDELVRSRPGRTIAEIVGHLIETRHQKLSRKSRSDSAHQPSLGL